MKWPYFTLLLFISLNLLAQAPGDTSLVTPFEKSHGLETATYQQVSDYYKMLADRFPRIMIGDAGITDIGLPLKVIYYSNQGKYARDDWKKEGKVVILINNDIHAGEPDGVDACMLMLRDIVTGKTPIPDNIVLVIVPVYNIGGALNRNSNSRANQNGPRSYGFRGNSRNLDLNRDFTKCDAAETMALEELFARTTPDIFVDNHVSDGADYQHIMTLLATQHDKLGGATGNFMYHTFTPALYASMKEKGYDLVPYVNDFDKTPDHGWTEFYDPPRYSSGYAALYHIIAYVPETHMLKPFRDRVMATHALLYTMIGNASRFATEIKKVRADDKAAMLSQKDFPLEWRPDTSRFDTVIFKGYEAGYKKSGVSGLPRLYYDRDKPYTRPVPFYDHFVPVKSATAPQAYVIPRTWVNVIGCLRANGVHIERLENDTILTVTAYHIDHYESLTQPYEKHYLHKNVKVSSMEKQVHFYEGDYLVPTSQTSRRYLVETLEPDAPDAFFTWNFFDGILQEKEYFSSYVFEDVAANLLKKDPELKARLEEKRKKDPAFAANAAAQLDFVYRNSPYLEQGYLWYPIFRLN